MKEEEEAEPTDFVVTPPINAEAQLQKNIALANRQAAHDMLEMKASSQVVTHFLALGNALHQLEITEKQLKIELIKVRIVEAEAASKSAGDIEEVLAALKSYSPYGEIV